MEPLAILQADPLDLLFENRNKSYGAYPLRKYYPQRLMISMGIITSLVILISFIYIYSDSKSSLQKHIQIPECVLQEINFTKEVKPPVLPTRPSVPKTPASLAYKTMENNPLMEIQQALPSCNVQSPRKTKMKSLYPLK